MKRLKYSINKRNNKMAARSVSESVYGMFASLFNVAATGGCERDVYSTPWGLARTHDRLCARATSSSQFANIIYTIYFARVINLPF